MGLMLAPLLHTIRGAGYMLRDGAPYRFFARSHFEIGAILLGVTT